MSVVDDPGRGDATEILLLARRRREKFDDLDLGRYLVQCCAVWAAAEWQAEASEVFCSTAQSMLTEFDVLLTAVEQHGVALERYAKEVGDISATQSLLRVGRQRAEEARDRSAVSLVVIEAEAQVQLDLPGLSTPDEYRSFERSMLQREIEVADRELARIGKQWAELVERREQADHAIISALHSETAMGSFVHVTEAAQSATTPEEALHALTGLTSFEVAALLAENPLLAVLAGQAAPGDVREWWDSLRGEGPAGEGGFSAAQLALLTGAPALLGNLDGMPPPARVRANGVVARCQLALNEAALERATGRSERESRELVEALRRENEYLGRAAAVPPTVQLYTYDRAGDRIVEMIGDWDAPPKRIYTYVPGTFSEMAGFWSEAGATQEVGRYLDKHDETDSVVFVYKDGRFPGGGGSISPTRTLGMAPGLLEANDQGFARESGVRLAAFQEGLRADPLFRTRPPVEVAVGHSWGLANVLASEVAGAHYDHVVSLAGAGAVKGWQPDSSTEYDSFRYEDVLGLAQGTGLVYEGRNPQSLVVFEPWTYESDGDRGLRWDSSWDERFTVLMENHSLIATSALENRDVLRQLLDEVKGKDVWPR